MSFVFGFLIGLGAVAILFGLVYFAWDGTVVTTTAQTWNHRPGCDFHHADPRCSCFPSGINVVNRSPVGGVPGPGGLPPAGAAPGGSEAEVPRARILLDVPTRAGKEAP